MTKSFQITDNKYQISDVIVCNMQPAKFLQYATCYLKNNSEGVA